MKIYKLYPESKYKRLNFQKLNRNILSILNKDEYEYVIYDYKYKIPVLNYGVAVFKGTNGKFAVIWLRNCSFWDPFRSEPLEGCGPKCTYSLQGVMDALIIRYLFEADRRLFSSYDLDFMQATLIKSCIDNVLNKLNELENKYLMKEGTGRRDDEE
jgi:hypothetical protein